MNCIENRADALIYDNDKSSYLQFSPLSTKIWLHLNKYTYSNELDKTLSYCLVKHYYIESLPYLAYDSTIRWSCELEFADISFSTL